jgi:Fur family transcriptional regulator, ferric uptake regulator
VTTLPVLAGLLRSRGLRLTATRQLVLDAVFALDHATPEQIRTAVAEHAAGVNITTVYRTLELLEELGLVAHTHLSHGAPTYHPAGSDQHVHLVCHECGQIEELPRTALGDLAAELARSHGFQLDLGHAALFGTCGDCGSAAPSGQVTPDTALRAVASPVTVSKELP